MEMTKRAQKWIELNDRQGEYYTQRDKYESGYHYNPRKCAIYVKKIVAIDDMLGRMTPKLTENERCQIEGHYACEMFDYLRG